MLIASGESQGRKLLIVGLSAENLRLLREGRPILEDLERAEIADGHLAIVAGETEREIADALLAGQLTFENAQAHEHLPEQHVPPTPVELRGFPMAADNGTFTELFAWVGADELALPGRTAEIGIKVAMSPAGPIPLVDCREAKLRRDAMKRALQQQSNIFGTTIRLCRFTFAGVVETIEPMKPKRGQS